MSSTSRYIKSKKKKWQWTDNCHLFDATMELNILRVRHTQVSWGTLARADPETGLASSLSGLESYLWLTNPGSPTAASES